jgi:hypothetical protein
MLLRPIRRMVRPCSTRGRLPALLAALLVTQSSALAQEAASPEAATSTSMSPTTTTTDETRAAARSLASQGAAALQEGRFAEAHELLSRAERLFHAPTHLMLMARALKGQGKLVAARETYLEVLREPPRDDEPPAFKIAREEAQTAVSELEGRIPNLRVLVRGAKGRTVLVKLDGVTVPPELVGVYRPVDPGDRVVIAYVTGASPVEAAVGLTEGQSQEVVLELPPPPLPDAIPPTPADSPDPIVETPASTKDIPVEPVRDPAAERGKKGKAPRAYLPLAITSYLLAAGGLGVGGYYTYLWKSRTDSANQLYANPDETKKRGDEQREFGIVNEGEGAVTPSSFCADAKNVNASICKLLDADDRAVAAGNIALGTSVAGGVMLITGIAFTVLHAAGGRADDGKAVAQSELPTPQQAFLRALRPVASPVGDGTWQFGIMGRF